MLSICIENFDLKILSEFKIKNFPDLLCDLHKLGANLYSKLPVATFSCKKVWHWKNGWVDGWMSGWMSGWMDGKSRVRTAYSNQK